MWESEHQSFLGQKILLGLIPTWNSKILEASVFLTKNKMFKNKHLKLEKVSKIVLSKQKVIETWCCAWLLRSLSCFLVFWAMMFYSNYSRPFQIVHSKKSELWKKHNFRDQFNLKSSNTIMIEKHKDYLKAYF